MDSSAKTKKVFVIDDDPLTCEMMKDVLQEGNRYSAEVFGTGEDCLKVMKNKPDAVILDFHLNEKKSSAMNGLEVLKKIKIVDYNIPVIMLSSQESYNIAAQTISKGAIHYVIKSDKAFEQVRNILNKMFKI